LLRRWLIYNEENEEMNKNIALLAAIFAVTASAFFADPANVSVVTYPAPSGGIPLSSDFSVTADGRQVDVYQVKVPPQWIGYTPCPSSYEIAAMAYFDFSGTVNVQITSSPRFRAWSSGRCATELNPL
jgi:hypothetical protein